MGSRGGQAFSRPARSRPRKRRGIACISRSTRCCSRIPSFGRGMSSFGPKLRWRSSWWKRPSGSKVPFGVVVFDAWYLAEDLVRVLARRRKDWISLLKKNRRLETASFHLRDANGWTLKLPGPHIAVEELVPLIPATCLSPRHRRRAHLLVLHAGGPHPRPGQGPHRGEL